MGTALSTSTQAAILKGFGSPPAPTTTFSLSAEQQTLLAELAETIIPTTSTPGAKEAQVPAFIQLALKDCYPDRQQKHFQKGLSAVDDDSKKTYGKAFVDLAPAQREAVLKQFEQLAKDEVKRKKTAPEKATSPETTLATLNGGSDQTQAKEVDAETGKVVTDAQKGQPLTPFFTLLKELTMLGYFSSEIGCTKALAYVAIPGRYVGVTPLKPGQKAWAV